MNEPLRVAYSREELELQAREFMIELFGRVDGSSDRNRWLEGLGLLIWFADRLITTPVKPDRIQAAPRGDPEKDRQRTAAQWADELSRWAEHPAESGFVPVHPETLRAIARILYAQARATRSQL